MGKLKQVGQMLFDDRLHDDQVQTLVVMKSDVAEADHPLETLREIRRQPPPTTNKSKAPRESCGIPSLSTRTRCIARSTHASQAPWIFRMIESCLVTLRESDRGCPHTLCGPG